MPCADVTVRLPLRISLQSWETDTCVCSLDRLLTTVRIVQMFNARHLTESSGLSAEMRVEDEQERERRKMKARLPLTNTELILSLFRNRKPSIPNV